MPETYSAAIQGEFHVDQNGSAVYSIALQVPPGTAGMEPALSFAYHSTVTDGLMGLGWSLQGMSAIQRTPPTPAPDGVPIRQPLRYNADDRFSLDGQRLMVVKGAYGQPGAEYRTEMDTFRRVRSVHTGDSSEPVSFVVESKEGIRYEYGAAPDARIHTNPGSGPVRVWALNRMSDRSGNFLTVQYRRDPVTAAFYPGVIEYTGNAAGLTPQRKVEFVYEERPRLHPRFEAGVRVDATLRLREVKTSVQSRAVLTYTLTYALNQASGRSQLESIVYADAKGRQVLPTQFEWLDLPQVKYGAAVPVEGAKLNPGAVVIPLDVSGSGRRDLIGLTRVTSGGLAIQLMKSRESGGYVSMEPQTFPELPWTEYGLLPMDIDGDGRTELLHISKRGSDLALTLLIPREQNGKWKFVQGTLHGAGPAGLPYGGQVIPMDVNGDGLVDLVYAYSSAGKLRLQTLLSNGNAFVAGEATTTELTYSPSADLLPADFDGNGVTDLLYASAAPGQKLALHVFVSDGKALRLREGNVLAGGVELPYGGSLIVAPLKEDSNDDLVYARSEGGRLAVYTLLGTGAGYQLLSAKPMLTDLPYNGQLMPTAARGAGMLELLAATQTASGEMSLHVMRWNGNGFDAPQPAEDGPRLRAGGQLIPADFTGRGKTDLLYSLRSTDALQFQLRGAPAVVPGRLRGIRDGMGGGISITYKPLTDSTVYDKGSSSPVPLLETRGLLNAAVGGSSWAMSPATAGALTKGSVGSSYALTSRQFPEYVVSDYVREDNRRNRYEYRYRYTGCRIDMTGRGWLGFASRDAIDVEAAACTTEEYQQLFPATGTVSKTTVKRISDNALLFRSTPTLAITGKKLTMSAPVLWASGTATGVYRTEVVKLVKERFTPGKTQPDITEIESDMYDEFGNLLQRRSEATNRPSVFFRHTYKNDVDSWVLGRLDESVTSADAEGKNILKRHRVNYDPKSGKPAEQSDWNDVRNAWLTTRFTYDPFGNEASATDWTGGETRREYDTTFRTFATRVVLPANEQKKALESTSETDPAFGKEIARTDPNGLRWTQTLDGIGRIVETAGPDANGKSMVLSRSAWGTDANGFFCETRQRSDWQQDRWVARRSYHDSLGREYLVVEPGPDGKSIRIERTHTGSGQARRVSLPHFEGDTPLFAEREYDHMGRIVRETEPTANGGTRIVETSYPRIDVEVRTEAGRETRSEVAHFLGEPAPLRMTDPEGGIVTCAYDALGRMVSAVDAAGVETRSQYDTLGRRVSLIVRLKDRVMASEAVEYDDEKRIRRIRTHEGNQVELHHDARGRLVRRLVNSTDITTWVYDIVERRAGDRLAAVTMPDGSAYAYTYDTLGNQIEDKLHLQGETWSTRRGFTPHGMVSSLTFPDGSQTKNTYNPSGQLTLIDFAEKGAEAARIAEYQRFTANLRPQTMLYGNGTRESFEFARTGQLRAQALRKDEEFVSHTAFEWDSAHQLTRIENRLDPSKSQTFGYDKTGRLTSAIRGQVSSVFGYDKAGNLTLKDGVTYTYSGQQVVSGTKDSQQVFSSSYDGDGNMVASHHGDTKSTLRYDGLGRLLSSGTATFSYDHEGRRLVKKGPQATTLYISQEFEVTLFANGARACTRYVPGPQGPIAQITRPLAGASAAVDLPKLDGIPSVGIRYLHTNQINSTTLHTDGKGTVTGRIEYKPFGEIESLTGDDDFRRKFTGKELDAETNLYYFRSRYYDPRIGRFITGDDRAGSAIERPDSLNRYAYVLNSPLTGIDFDGHFRWDILADVLLGVAAVTLIVAATIMTGGAAAAMIGLAGSVLMGAAVNGTFNSISQNGDNFSWSDWGIEVGIGALTGLMTGMVTGGGIAVGGAIRGVIVGTSKSLGWRALGALVHVAVSAGIGAASGTVAGIAGNALRHEAGLSSAVSTDDAAKRGAWTGAVSGGLGALSGIFVKPLAQASASQRLIGATHVMSAGVKLIGVVAVPWAVVGGVTELMDWGKNMVKPGNIDPFPAPRSPQPSTPRPSLRFTPVY